MAPRHNFDVLWLQKGAQIRMSEWSQSFTLTKNVGWGFFSAPHLLHNGLSDIPIFRGITVTFHLLTHLPHMIIVAFHLILYLEERCEINQHAKLCVTFLAEAKYWTVSNVGYSFNFRAVPRRPPATLLQRV